MHALLAWLPMSQVRRAYLQSLLIHHRPTSSVLTRAPVRPRHRPIVSLDSSLVVAAGPSAKAAAIAASGASSSATMAARSPNTSAGNLALIFAASLFHSCASKTCATSPRRMRWQSGRGGMCEWLPQHLPTAQLLLEQTVDPFRGRVDSEAILMGLSNKIFRCAPDPKCSTHIGAGLVHETGHGHSSAHLTNALVERHPVVVKDKQTWTPSVLHCVQSGSKESIVEE